MLCKMPGGQWRTGLAKLDLCAVGAPSGQAKLAPTAERSSAVSGLRPLTARPRGAARDFDALRASKSSPRSAQKKACFLLGTAGAEAGFAGLRAAPPLRVFIITNIFYMPALLRRLAGRACLSEQSSDCGL